MKKLNLRSKASVAFLEIPVDFIDSYMAEAPEEALKVYLYLLRSSMDSSIILSLNDMADLFDVTPKKIAQALTYWESLRLLSLEYSDGEISDITILPVPKKDAAGEVSVRETVSAEVPAEDRAPMTIQVPSTPVAPAKVSAPAPIIDMNALANDDSFTEILNLAEHYLRKPVTTTMREALAVSYVVLGRDWDMVEYLLEYCIDRGHSAPQYLKAVANNWAEEGFRSLDDVKAATQNRSRQVYGILNALGIKGREPVAAENDFIARWTKDFELPVIIEACNRTMNAIHTADFKYTNAILDRWKAGGVQDIKDIEILDKKHQETADKNAAKNAQKKNSFHNFPERDTDYNKLFGIYVGS